MRRDKPFAPRKQQSRVLLTSVCEIESVTCDTGRGGDWVQIEERSRCNGGGGGLTAIFASRLSVWRSQMSCILKKVRSLRFKLTLMCVLSANRNLPLCDLKQHFMLFGYIC